MRPWIERILLVGIFAIVSLYAGCCDDCDIVATTDDDDTTECQAETWCTIEASDAFNNMQAGSFGEMLETEGMTPFSLCGFQMRVGQEGGIIGEISGSCRGVLYRVNADDSVTELAAVAMDGVSGTTDILFDSPVAISSGERYAIVLETVDAEWGLWQCSNAGENCCPNARPVGIHDGFASYSDASMDDYYFILWTR
jgi:hypothetical protein